MNSQKEDSSQENLNWRGDLEFHEILIVSNAANIRFYKNSRFVSSENINLMLFSGLLFFELNNSVKNVPDSASYYQ